MSHPVTLLNGHYAPIAAVLIPCYEIAETHLADRCYVAVSLMIRKYRRHGPTSSAYCVAIARTI